MGDVAIFEKGAAVLVHCAGGRLSHNVVWQDCGDVVMVCGKAQFERLRDGYPAPMPIGFKRADVALQDRLASSTR